MKKQKIHPIWWLVGFSLFIGVLNYALKDRGSEATTTTAPVDYKAEVDKAINEIAAEDSHGDESMRGYYFEAIYALDESCSENLSEVLKLSFNEVDRRGDLGVQFAVLNELEDTVHHLSQAPSTPVACAPLIAKSSH